MDGAKVKLTQHIQQNRIIIFVRIKKTKYQGTVSVSVCYTYKDQMFRDTSVIYPNYYKH